MVQELKFGERFQSFSEFYSAFNKYCEHNHLHYNVVAGKFITNCSRTPSDLTTIGYLRELKYSHINYRCDENQRHACPAHVNLKAISKNSLGIVSIDNQHNHPYGPLLLEINRAFQKLTEIFVNSNITDQRRIIHDLELVHEKYPLSQEQTQSEPPVQDSQDQTQSDPLVQDSQEQAQSDLLVQDSQEQAQSDPLVQGPEVHIIDSSHVSVISECRDNERQNTDLLSNRSPLQNNVSELDESDIDFLNSFSTNVISSSRNVERAENHDADILNIQISGIIFCCYFLKKFEDNQTLHNLMKPDVNINILDNFSQTALLNAFELG